MRKGMRMWAAMLLALTLVLGGLLPGGSAVSRAEGRAIIDPRLTESFTLTEQAEVIVTFHGDEAPTAQQLALLEQVGITRGITFQSLPMAGVLATRAQVEALAADPQVRSLYLNRPLTYYNAGATEITGVDRARSEEAFTSRNGGMPVSGKGVTVVVNDSGVDGTHPDHEYGRTLIQNVMGTTNLNALSGLLPVSYTEGIANTDTNSGHGTHVAGTVAGNGSRSGGKYEGVAPGASLVGYGSGAALLILDAVGGFDYALTHQAEYGIRVITNSWGSSGTFDPEDPVNIASYKAYKRNMVVTFAAGNEGPGEDTHNPYAKAPWVISVAAGTKQGGLADFSSRGVKGHAESFQFDGRTWTWKDQPTVTAPGVDIISTRALAVVSSLGADADAATIEPGYLPYYTTMSGTSMATPHVAGIVALMLEANPLLTPDQVKQILVQTSTNMPGREDWEVGAGYVNAYAAVDRAFQEQGYGSTLNLGRQFNANVSMTTSRTDFTVSYNPLLTASNRIPVTVPAGLSEMVAKVITWGMAESGNTINLVMIAPDGTEYSSGVNLLFALYPDRTVVVPQPAPGTWHLELRGLRGDTANPVGVALPEEIPGTLTFKSVGGFTGLSDIGGHPAAGAIQVAIAERLMDSYPDGTFKPDRNLTRMELAKYLVMGAGVRQYLPLDGSRTFGDVANADRPFAEAVAARGAALRDGEGSDRGVILPKSGSFKPGEAVTRAELAYSLVQSLGLEAEALAQSGEALTVQYGDSRIAIEDGQEVPAELRGYVQLALDLNILNAYFHTTQGPFDLQPTVHANFRPAAPVTRGEYAVAVTRFYSANLIP